MSLEWVIRDNRLRLCIVFFELKLQLIKKEIPNFINTARKVTEVT